VERDLAEIGRLGLRLVLSIDTHIHADHITAARELKKRTGSRIAVAAFDCLPCADIGIEDAQLLSVGSPQLQSLHTPGHIDGHFTFVSVGRLFSGDALLIDGCGRTDFQNGDPAALHHSVTARLFALPDETLV
jgi:sulfur dioxygenase